MKKYQLGLYEKAMPKQLTWDEKFHCAKKYGFDSIEISIDETEEKLARLDMPLENRKALVAAMFQSGIRIRTMCLSGHRKYPLGSSKAEDRDRAMTIMKKAIDFADDVGIKIIQLAGYDVYYEESNEETKKYFEKNLRKAVEMAASKGVILAFETMETEFMNTVGKAMKYVNVIQSPFLQVYPDCGNLTNAILDQEMIAADFYKGNGHLAAMHLKETIPGKFREIEFGTGHVNFAEIIKTAWDLGVRHFTTEFWYTGNEDWEEVIQNTKKYIDKKFEQALK